MKKPLTPVLAATLIATTISVPHAHAQEADTSQCPAMHMVIIHDSADSTAQSGQNDSGFLGQVVAPVLDASNSGDQATTAGFEQEETTTVDSDWRPNVWGETTTTTTTQSGQDWRPNVWGTSTVSAPVEQQAPTETPSVTTTPAEEKEETAQVTRTYISLQGATSEGFIPGVHGNANNAYSAAISTGVEDTNNVLDAISQACPTTKVVLMGHREGAQVASEVAREIGSGESNFPAENIAGVALFADPTRLENQPVAQTDDLKIDGPQGAGIVTRQVADNPAETTPEDMAAPQSFGSLEDKTLSWCLEGDASCAMEKETPLARINAANTKNLDARDPHRSLAYVADNLGPAVLLGTAETLAEDLNFGANGFSFTRAAGPEETLLGRIATNMETETPQTERENRLRVAALSLGGMGLAAGITVAKKVVTPENIAQIAAAASANPTAGAVLAGVTIGKAALELITPETATTAALRVMDETKAAGLETPEVAEAAVEAAVYRTVSRDYATTPVSAGGMTPTDTTTQWLMGLAADTLGAQAPTELVEAASTIIADVDPATYDVEAIAQATKNVEA